MIDRTYKLTVHLSEEELEALRDMAQDAGEPMSTVVRRLIRKAGAKVKSW